MRERQIPPLPNQFTKLATTVTAKANLGVFILTGADINLHTLRAGLNYKF